MTIWQLQIILNFWKSENIDSAGRIPELTPYLFVN